MAVSGGAGRMSLPAGRLRHRVSLFGFAVTQDPTTGDMTESYSLFAENIPAEFVPVSARDFIAAQAGQAQVVARVRIRYRDGVRSTMRLQFRGAMYNIEGVLPDPDSGLEFLTLAVSQVTSP